MVTFVGLTRDKDCDAEIGMRSWFRRLLVSGGVFVAGLVLGVVVGVVLVLVFEL